MKSYPPEANPRPASFLRLLERSVQSLSVASLALLYFGSIGAASSATLPFSYTLSGTGKTSVGVYSTGTVPVLVRTLWSGSSQSAGTYTSTWDGLNDDGTVAAAGTYTIKALFNDVQYTWKGVVGNTSSSFTSTNSTIWRSWVGFHDMAFAATGTTAFATMAYGESELSVFKFNPAAPQSPQGVTKSIDPAAVWTYCATDGTRLYLASTGGDDADSGWDPNNSCFVTSFDITGTNAATFTSGTIVRTVYGTGTTTYNSCIDAYQLTGTRNVPFVQVHKATGLAVQQSGTILAVSHGGLNQVSLYNKTTGASLGTISLTAPGRVGFAANGDLWVISGNTILGFTGATLGMTDTPVASITGLVAPLGFGVDPVSGNVIVADGGTSQQVKAYDSAGNLQWTYGTAGGYNAANGPDVTNAKFRFTVDSKGYPIPYGFVAVQSDGSFWVSDGGNCRMLHFSSSRAYLGQISSITNGAGMCVVDPNNPTRIFAKGWMEYKLDYGVPLNPGDPDPAFGGNGSWKLVKNWAAGQPVVSGTGYSRMTNVTTLTSGTVSHTYATVYQNGYGYTALAELPASGPLRIILTGSTPIGVSTWLAPNGDLRYCKYTSVATTPVTHIETIYQQAFTGFDASGNPVWAAPTVLASASANPGDPYSWFTANYCSWTPVWLTFPVTDSNTVISFAPHQGTVSYPDYHLGGIPVGGTSWQFKTSKALSISTPDGKGTYPTQNGNGNHNGTNVWSVGRNVLWNYDGQYASFSNQFVHYWDDGLFIGQFGTTKSVNNDFQHRADAGYAANYGETSMAKGPDGDLYAFSGDEFVHAGIHVWKMSNTASIVEFSGAGTLGQTGTLALNSPPVDLPTGWADVDIGTCAIPGSAVYNSGTWTIKGSGLAISTTADRFNFCSESYTGDGSVTAYIPAITYGGTGGRVGVMMRGSIDANAVEASVTTSSDPAVSFRYRSTVGGATTYVAVAGINLPVWVKVKRVGSTFSGWYSSDGTNWTQISTNKTITMPNTVLAGMCACGNDTTLTTATYTNVTVVP